MSKFLKSKYPKEEEESSEEESEEEDSEDEKKPAGKKPAAQSAKKFFKGASSEEESEEEEEENEDEKKPAPKTTPKPSQAKSASAKPTDSKASKFLNDDEDEEEDEDEDDEKPAKKSADASKNKFFKGASSEEEEEEEEDNEEEEEEEEEEEDDENKSAKKAKKPEEEEEPEDDLSKADKKKAAEKAKEKSDEAKIEIKKKKQREQLFQEEEEEEEEKIQLSLHSQKIQQLQALLDDISKSALAHEWTKVTDTFAQLQKTYQKSLLKKDEVLPALLIKIFLDIEKFSNEDISENKKLVADKKMKSSEVSALRKFSSALAKNNTVPVLLKKIEKYRESPQLLDTDIESELKEVEKEKETKAQEKKEARSKKISRDKLFLASSSEEEEEEGEEDDKEKVQGEKKSRKTKKDIETRLSEQEEKKTFQSEGEIHDEILKISQALSTTRKTDTVGERKAAAKRLGFILAATKLIGNYVEALSLLISAQIQATVTSIEAWETNAKLVLTLFYLVVEKEIIPKEMMTFEEKMPMADFEKTKSIPIYGSFSNYLEALDDSYSRLLEIQDPHKRDYVNCLMNEAILLDIAEKCMYLHTNIHQDSHKLLRIHNQLIEHLFHRTQQIHNKFMEKQRSKSAEIQKDSIAALKALPWLGFSGDKITNLDFSFIGSEITVYMDKLVALIYQNGEENDQKKALLLHVFHLAANNQYVRARDILVLSRLQESIPNEDSIFLQILLNRSLCALGLCAFRDGKIREAHDVLSDYFQTTIRAQPKELLAQGVTKNQQKKTEIIEQRCFPHHLHINIDKLEAIYYICSMLLEIPNLDPYKYFGLHKKQNVSRAFRNLLGFYDRQCFQGPAESTRDHINIASHALAEGDWETCYSVLLKLKMWKIMVDSSKTEEMLKNHIKVAALKVYLLQNARHYQVMSMDQLAEKYQLSQALVYNTVAKMIISEELGATLDEEAKFIRVYQVNVVTKFNQVSLQLNEKVQKLSDFSDQLNDLKQGKVTKKNRKKYQK